MSPEDFLAQYDEQVSRNAELLRNLLYSHLPDIKEQVDLPAKMIAFTYGQKYAELVCVIIPSKKGLKLGFNQGNELPDPKGLLQGTGKISRYVEIHSSKDIQSPALKKLLVAALKAYHERMQTAKKK